MNAQPDRKSFDNREAVEQPRADAGRAPAEAPKAEAQEPAPAPVAEKPRKKRRPIRKLLIVGLPLVLAVVGSYYWVTGGRYINTEDAYVQQDRVTVMPQVSGQIASVNVAENQHVKAGQLLFAIDDSVYQNAVEQAKANLESARLDVEKLKASYSQAQSQLETAKDSLQNAQTQYDRQHALVKKGIVSQSTLDQTDLQLRQAKGAVASAESQLLGAKAALAGNPDIAIDQHPAVLKALAELHAAELDLEHTQGLRDRGGRRQPDRPAAGRPVRDAGLLGSQSRGDRQQLDRGELQGDRPDRHERRPAGRGRARHLSGSSAEGDGRFDRRRHRLGIRAASGAERHRQLGEGRPAHPGAHDS